MVKTIFDDPSGILTLIHNCVFIKDGEVFHQIFRGGLSNEELYAKISDTLTVLTTGGDKVND